jgi:preprotein translocase subunit SecA
MGQKDPLVEWQREGFEMFGTLMKGIAQDFVRYVMHVQVVKNETPAPQVQNLQESSADDDTSSGFARAAAGEPGELTPASAAATARALGGARSAVAPATPAKQEPMVRDDWSKTPRNAPCPCGSGKKFKQCHGA